MSCSSFGTTRGSRSAKSGGRSRPMVARISRAVSRGHARGCHLPRSIRAGSLPSVDQVLQRPELAPLVARPRPARRAARAARRCSTSLRQRAAGASDGRRRRQRGAGPRRGGPGAHRARPSGRRSSASSTPPASWSTPTSAAPRSRRRRRRAWRGSPSSYSNLEYDLARGERGEREVHAEARLRGAARTPRPRWWSTTARRRCSWP